MPNAVTPFDWSTRSRFDWLSDAGIARLRNVLQPLLPFPPADFQLRNTARLLMGDDVLCVSATGDGKSALMYMYTLAREGTMAITISPTNSLESDMVKNLAELGIPAVAINSDTLAAAHLQSPRRNLWAEATSGQYKLVLFSPETLKTSAYRLFIAQDDVRARLGLFCVDECHLVDEWGTDFREAYAQIARARADLPEWTSILGLTATLEPGRQTNVVTSSLGLRPNAFHFDKRDCERHNIDIIIRAVKYTSSTNDFRDLDWLIPTTMTRPCDIPKTLIYCNTIELGHRISLYLRKLLPQPLQSNGRRIIRHMHSLNCTDCKREGLDSLYQTGHARETGIHCATDVLGAGINVKDYERVVCFATPSSASAMVQRIGRAARARDSHGIAYVYIKKTDIEATRQYLEKTQFADLDGRLVPPRPDSLAEELSASSDSDQNDAEGTELPGTEAAAVPGLNSHNVPPIETALETANPKKRTKKKPTLEGDSDGKPKLCPSLRLVIAAHLRGACITRQINHIYQNPGASKDCGRCSSCVAHPVPEPRPLPDAMSDESALASDKTPAYMKLTAKDATYVATRLKEAAFDIRLHSPRHPDFLLLDSECFLTDVQIRRITEQFHLVISQEVLRDRMSDWRYWDTCGSALWQVVDGLVTEMKETLHDRHQAVLEKRRAANQLKAQEKVRAELADAGLTGIKRVTLRLPAVAATASRVSSADKENVPLLPLSESSSGARKHPSSFEPQCDEPLAKKARRIILKPPTC